MNNFRDKFQKFMYGRYGVDEYSRFLSRLVIVLLLLAFIPYLQILELVALVLMGYSFYRIFSRKIAARAQENQNYFRFRQKTTAFFRNLGTKISRIPKRIREARLYHIYKCPGCAQKIRIPRGKGHIIVRCPRCGREFEEHS